MKTKQWYIEDMRLMETAEVEDKDAEVMAVGVM